MLQDNPNAFLLIGLLIVFLIAKGWGGIYFPFTKTGRRILSIAKVIKERWYLWRAFSFWCVLSRRSYRISLKGDISGSPVVIEISNAPKNPFSLDIPQLFGTITIFVLREDGFKSFEDRLIKSFSAEDMQDEEILSMIDGLLRQ